MSRKAYSALPMEDLEDVTMNPFSDPSVQNMLSTDVPSSSAAAAGGSAGAGTGGTAASATAGSSYGIDLASAASATAALAGFMSGLGGGGGVSGSMASTGGGGAGGAASSGFGAGPQPFENTLDEPVSTTLLRELRQVGTKMAYVLIPRRNKNLLRDWDLWGPLFLCLALALILSATAPESQSAIVFTGVFVIVWCGAGVITLNSKLLGGRVSFFQSVCVLGYCICPLVLVAFVGLFVPIVLVRVILVTGAFLWSSYAALVFLSEARLEGRQALAVYPIVLFYFVVGWMVLISKSILD